MKKSLSILLSCVALMGLTPASFAQTAPKVPAFVWIEGEAPTSSNLPVAKAGWGNKQFLSGEAWGQVNLDADKVDGTLPAGGAVIQYKFSIEKAGDWQVWNRVGYEFVRSPFEWRVDNGAWQTVSPEQLTTDLMEIATWTEIAWLKLGNANLTAGAHTLEIRLTKRTDKDGKTDRILYASDALCLTHGPFYPNGKFSPGNDGRTEDDKKAEGVVFDFGSPSSTRTTVKLSGLWEVCRNDENAPKNIATPMQDFPAATYWRAIPVPSDKNQSRPDLKFAHRLWYRTRVKVPAEQADQSFSLYFPQNCLNTTVYVNGVYCGFNKNPHAPFTIDVTKGMKPGQVNEIWVGIRDAWYGYSENPTDPMKLRRKFNLPLDFAGQGFQDLAYPVWNAFRSGILTAPTLTATGPVYASDVFVQTSVAKKTLTADITLSEPTGKGATGEIVCEALDAKTGQVANTLPPQRFTLAPGGNEQTVSVSGAWANPVLWWPEPNPQLYRLRTTVKLAGKAVDVSETTFGFREWGSRGKDFLLNGIVWHGWADVSGASSPTAWLKMYRDTNQRLMRLMGYAQGGQTWNGLEIADALDFFDREGVVVRRSGILDGEAIGYMAIENDPDLKKKYGSEIKVELLQNWHDQFLQQVKGERNHPSIHVWSIENEFLYINCINLYSGLMDEFESWSKRTSDDVQKLDPTRLTMVDGGGAGKANVLPIHGDHYIFSPDDTRYPELAYEANPTGGGRGRWTWDQKRPRYPGEDYFANGINPADFAMYGGEEAFQGKASTRKAAGNIQRMLTEGYRWAEFGAMHFWLGRDEAEGQYISNSPLAVFCKDYDSTFTSGQTVKRSLGIFNDTFHETRPIAFTWTLMLGGKQVATKTTTHNVAPGENEKFTVTVPMPRVAVSGRLDGSLTLSLAVGGKTVFTDKKAVSVLGGVKPALTPGPSPNAGRGESVLISTRAIKPRLLVFDPKNSVAPYLKAHGIPFTPVIDLARLPSPVGGGGAGGGGVLIIGKDALDSVESSSSRLAAWASTGNRVIVLEQTNPLRYQGLPAAMEPSNADGRIAYADDLGHPVLKGLTNRDFYTWGPDQVVYRHAYLKPTSGAKSLIQCHIRLANTALAEIPVGKGLILVSQLRIAETLATNAVAQRLLANLLDYGASYRLEFRPVTLAMKDAGAIPTALKKAGVGYKEAADPMAALKTPGTKIAVIGASPANLKTLVANLPMVQAFTKNGGYLVFSGLTPDGLADYDKIVGVNHLIRPFRRERVTFPAKKHPLTAGLTTGDIVLQSGQRINNYTSDTYLASDVFTYCVDYDEVAPFAKLPDSKFWGYDKPENDHDPYNMVNGFYSADGWQYIFSIWAGTGKPTPIPFTFAKPQTITRLEWAGNAFYWPTTKVELTFDGKSPVSFATEPNNEPQTFSVKAPGPASEVTLRITDWAKRSDNAIVGVDNVRLFAARSPEFYKKVHPLLNIGALMEYDLGAGGAVLCNILFKETEEVPENAAKKARILGTILGNLKAPIAGERTLLPGTSLTYTPIDIGKQANQYRNEQGWFGDKQYTFGALPTGRQTLAGVPYQIYDFPTSPVPTAIMLGGGGVPGNLPDAVRGIPVNRKADALFFLQSARIDQRRDERERRENRTYEMARYVIHYADGQTVTVPIYSEIDVDDYRQEGEPRAIPGAQIAWTRPYADGKSRAVAYSQQWTNPRPNVAIASIDLEYGKDRRGVPVLLALTAGEVRK